MKKNGQFALLIFTLLISITLINSESSLHIWSSINLDQKLTSVYKHKNFISEAPSAYQVSGAVNLPNSQRAYLEKKSFWTNHKY